ncbi:hypothetical protein ACFRAO_44470 [Streptomyces sp. NPDC056656]|uniref:hypothetical protein n=1 Tax=Streptomyces sp. NPDC056656 TaxID=3345895 RepID=UPI0036A20959
MVGADAQLLAEAAAQDTDPGAALQDLQSAVRSPEDAGGRRAVDDDVDAGRSSGPQRLRGR